MGMTKQQKIAFYQVVKNALKVPYPILAKDFDEIADKTFVINKVANAVSLLRGGADADHDTLKELADAIVAQAQLSDEIVTVDDLEPQDILLHYTWEGNTLNSHGYASNWTIPQVAEVEVIDNALTMYGDDKEFTMYPSEYVHSNTFGILVDVSITYPADYDEDNDRIPILHIGLPIKHNFKDANGNSQTFKFITFNFDEDSLDLYLLENYSSSVTPGTTNRVLVLMDTSNLDSANHKYTNAYIGEKSGNDNLKGDRQPGRELTQPKDENNNYLTDFIYTGIPFKYVKNSSRAGFKIHLNELIIFKGTPDDTNLSNLVFQQGGN